MASETLASLTDHNEQGPCGGTTRSPCCDVDNEHRCMDTYGDTNTGAETEGRACADPL